MWNTYLVVKTVHIISGTILFGTGLGIAFFMWWTNQFGDMNAKYSIAKTTVIADFCFTTPSVILQPLTGFWLIYRVGYEVTQFWIIATLGLYLLAGICWLPVVWIQIQLRNILKVCIERNAPLPARYIRLYRLWFCLGWPAFFGLVVVFWLMVAKPI